MSAQHQLNPSDIPAEQLDRILFAIIGRMQKLTVVEKLLTREEAADYISYAPSTLDRFVAQGLIESEEIEPGADPRFRPSKLLAAFKPKRRSLKD